MKLTKETLKRIIKEELEAVMGEETLQEESNEKMLQDFSSSARLSHAYERQLKRVRSRQLQDIINGAVLKHAKVLDNKLGNDAGAIDNIAKKLGIRDNDMESGGLPLMIMKGRAARFIENQLNQGGPMDTDNVGVLQNTLQQYALLGGKILPARSFLQKAGSFLTGKGFKEE